jgi:hypothetical protein
MHRTPWALALLALSLPAPALSDPLHRLNITHAAWNPAYGDAYADPGYADRPWQRYSDPADDALDDRPRLSWRERAANRLLGRPSAGYGYGEAPSDGYRDSYEYGYRPGRRTPLAVIPARPQPAPRCGAGPALVGAAIGGGLGAALSDGSRQRQWALPIGATVGGLLGGVLAGC